MQSEHIRGTDQRVGQEALPGIWREAVWRLSCVRVLPGFKPDSKINMLLQLRDQAEVIIINASDIEKIRSGRSGNYI